MRTEELIRELAADARPVHVLPSPARRAVGWLLPAVAYAAAVIWAMGLRPDIEARLVDPRFVIELGAALSTAVLAALAAFGSCVPGRSHWERLLPLPALAVWLASLGEGCWQTFMRFDAGGMRLAPDPGCLPSIILAGALPGALIIAMVRRGAPIAPAVTGALAALAAAALGAAALRLFHPEDASLMVLVWQLGSVALLTLLGAFGGRRLLRWSAALSA